MHNGLVTDATPTGSLDELKLTLPNNGSGWDGINAAPVMETTADGTFAYVLYDGYTVSGDAGGGRLAKVNCMTGELVWNIQLSQTSGFQLSTPYLDTTAGAIYVGTTEYNRMTDNGNLRGVVGSITKVTGLDDTPTTQWTYSLPDNNQINTPIVKIGEYLYFGTWSANSGTYYQAHLDSQTGEIDELLPYNPDNGGFYWAGAVVSGDYVYFGGDGGYLYAQPVGSGFGSSADPVNLNTVDGNLSAGNVRSTISLVDDSLYFTSQGGYLWCFDHNNGNPVFNWKASLAATSTSTPTVTSTDIYVGYYSGFDTGGIQKINRSTHAVTTVATPGPIQGSVLVYQADDADYLYVNTNSATGAGYCYDASGAQKWATSSGTYALQGMAASNGYIVFGNDYDQLYIISDEGRIVVPSAEIPDNSDELKWPADSQEVTLWYGELDDQCAVFNQGISIQGPLNSSVYSVCDGVVAYKGYSKAYGYVLYIDFKYNGNYMQARYGNLQGPSSMRVGEAVSRGQVIGKMAPDPEQAMSQSGKGAMALDIGMSNNERPCQASGSNIAWAGPIPYLESRQEENTEYLTKPMATVRDTSGLDYNISEDAAFSPATRGTISELEKDRRFRRNKDLQRGEGYLRKVVLDVAKQLDNGATNENLEEKKYLVYNVTKGAAEVNIMGRKREYSIAKGNARIQNSRMIVDKAAVYRDLYIGQHGIYSPVVPAAKEVGASARLASARANYLYNEANISIPGDGKVGGYVNGQQSTRSAIYYMHYGSREMNYNGCEIIAMYNALIALENKHKMNTIANWGQLNALFAQGELGTCWWKADDFFKKLKYNAVEYKASTLSQWDAKIQACDVAIISYWNNTIGPVVNPFDGLHSIAVVKNAEGGFTAYNRDTRSRSSKDYASIQAMVDEIREEAG
ncbi:peptidoglycan DD-metalloendopeptidase family protein [Bacilliculturomica massiliensis]|uniref:peptidoglycan DD-metalloendopeptidase family protein n=1 Tax=Bacilliculturomica massiliensis TaxID=1917867 RepID=UPI001030ED03|nr:peptidoglycan DD-metalloendopeptidase family protein [Bacilliculturomica massiliensis]